MGILNEDFSLVAIKDVQVPIGGKLAIVTFNIKLLNRFIENK